MAIGSRIDDILHTRFTRRMEISNGSSYTLSFSNTYGYSTWAGDVEVKVAIFRPGVSATCIGSYWTGGTFVISGGGFQQADITVRRESGNVSGDFDAIFSVNGSDSKSMDIVLANGGADCSAVCNVEFYTAYGFLVSASP